MGSQSGELKKDKSFWHGAFRALARRRGAALGLGFLTLLALAAYFAPLLANNKPLFIEYDGKAHFTAFRDLFPVNLLFRPDAVSLRLQADPDWLLSLKILPDPKVGRFLLPPVPYSPLQQRLDDVSAAPSVQSKHYFGCDDNGRDVLSRMIHGAKVSLLVGLLAVGLSGLIGVAIGALAGFTGGWLDTLVLSRLMEVMACFPTFFLILTVVAVMDPKYLNIWTIVLVIALTSWTGMARFARAEFIRLRGADFVSAAKALGASPLRLAVRHMLPNAVAPLLVNASFDMAGAVLFEAAISFLGVGVQPPDPSWGNILNLVTRYWDQWWLGLFPGAAIFLTVLSYNLLGEGVRDALDPRAIE
jgi:peptide/nickel transport system permease protein